MRLYKRTFKQENRRGLENTYSQENVLDCHCNFSNIIDTYSNKDLDYVYQELTESAVWVLFILQF